jgi:hypothetical protein
MRVPGITESNRRWWVLGTMAGSLSMIMIDQAVASVALPSMHRDVQLSAAGRTMGRHGYVVTAGVMVAIATAPLHRRHPVRDDGLNAPRAKTSPTLTVLDQRELTAV